MAQNKRLAEAIRHAQLRMAVIMAKEHRTVDDIGELMRIRTTLQVAAKGNRAQRRSLK